MESASGTGNAFLGNSIFSNARLGIDLAANDVTPNDVGDSDAGANNQQNFPVLTSAVTSAGTTTISGTLNSTATSNFRIEFFSNALADPTDFGEGQTFVGFTTVTTDVNGNANISFSPTGPVALGLFISSTATKLEDTDQNLQTPPVPTDTSEFSKDVCSADEFTVVNTNDSGPGSLRQAILNANVHSNALNSGGAPDLVSFSIVGAGVHTISPTSALPTITEEVVIDGYTQPGASANTLAVGNDSVHLIELNGVNRSFSGLVIGSTGGGSTIRGLVINRFSFGIVVNSDNNVIDGNFIGTDPAGNTALGNSIGVHVTTGANNLIGGTTPPARNVISANVAGGVGNVWVDGLVNFQGVPTAPFPSGTLIRGNYIGTNAAGLAGFFAGEFGNSDGVVVVRSTGTIIGGSDADDTSLDGNVGARNVISGNVDGIHTEEVGTTYAADITVQGNFIGVNATGNVALGNFGNGIFFSPQRERSDNFITVGGTAAGAGNVISGNTAVGVVIANSNVMMQGNRIGTNLAGTLDLGNGNAGVELTRGGSPPFPVVQFTVGGATPAARNIISGNGGFGLRVSNVSGSATVQGNYIGTLSDGISPLGNDSDGIFAQEAQGGATIGGTNIGEGNVIAFNGGGVFGGAGINIPSAAGITILGNSIFSNRGLGIDLFGNGITPNDLPANKDSDTGPNNLQNFPVITGVAGNVISATLNSLSGYHFSHRVFR